MLIEEEGVGLPGLLCDEEDPVRRLHDSVQDLGIGDQNVLERHRELNGQRVSHSKPQSLGERERSVRRNAQHLIPAHFERRLAAHL